MVPPQSIQSQSLPKVRWAKLGGLYVVFWILSIQLLFWCGDITKLRAWICAFVYPSLLIVIALSPVFRSVWPQLSRGARIGSIVLALVMINAQLLRNSERTYPLSAWTMYADKTPESLAITEFVGVYADGSRQAIDLAPLIANPRGMISLLLQRLAEDHDYKTNDAVKSARLHASLDALFQEIAQRHARHENRAPPQRIELISFLLDSTGAFQPDHVRYATDLIPNSAHKP